MKRAVNTYLAMLAITIVGAMASLAIINIASDPTFAEGLAATYQEY